MPVLLFFWEACGVQVWMWMSQGPGVAHQNWVLVGYNFYMFVIIKTQ